MIIDLLVIVVILFNKEYKPTALSCKKLGWLNKTLKFPFNL